MLFLVFAWMAIIALAFITKIAILVKYLPIIGFLFTIALAIVSIRQLRKMKRSEECVDKETTDTRPALKTKKLTKRKGP